jgi:UDP-N-acetylglucosamine:LPS N-acetylglucosamine transferase
MTNVLFAVSSVGLGHVKRSLIIANALRSVSPNVRVEWMCAEPALTFLRLKGEAVSEVCCRLESMSTVFEENSHEGQMRDMADLARLSYSVAKRNYEMIRPHLSSYDALVQDEFMETLLAHSWDPDPPIPERRAVVTDYVKIETSSLNPYNRVVVLYANMVLKKGFMRQTLRIFADDPDALPDEPRLRRWVETNFLITGPIVEDVPRRTKEELKRELFGLPSERRLIVFSIGGTSIGKRLLKLVADNADTLGRRLDSTLALLIGPRLEPSNFAPTTETLRIAPFTTDAIKYFAAADCLVTQAGASTLNEASVLSVPCVCIPIENHWEQLRNAQRFSKRFGFEVLTHGKLSLETLSETIERAMMSSRRAQRKFSSGEAGRVAAQALSSLINTKT